LVLVGLQAVGGWSGLETRVPPDFFSMWKPASHPDFPWTGIVFGAPILGVWYWCTDQHIVQRVLAARNITEARRGTLFAGFLKILPVFIFVLPLIRRAYRSTGRMTEKYDVVDLNRRAGGGEYPTQDGFGWTNGVALGLEDLPRRVSKGGLTPGRRPGGCAAERTQAR
jgi:hypothetical protein